MFDVIAWFRAVQKVQRNQETNWKTMRVSVCLELDDPLYTKRGALGLAAAEPHIILDHSAEKCRGGGELKSLVEGTI